MFGAKADEVGRLRAERRSFNPLREFHRVIGYDLMFYGLQLLSKIAICKLSVCKMEMWDDFI